MHDPLWVPPNPMTLPNSGTILSDKLFSLPISQVFPLKLLIRNPETIGKFDPYTLAM